MHPDQPKAQEQVVQLQYNEHEQPKTKLQIHNLNENYQIKQALSKKLSAQGLVVRYDFQNQLAAIGCKNGDRLIYDVNQHKIVEKYSSSTQNPVGTLRWRPMGGSNKKTLVTADSQGWIQFWHIPSLKKLFFMRQEAEQQGSMSDNKFNSINTLDFNRSGSAFATGGKDCNIRIYDEETKSLSMLLRKSNWKNTGGHDNRVFAVRFIDEKTLISGGWDSVIHIWDLRQGKSIRKIHGANISGQSLDFQDGRILAGCHSVKNQIQIYDFNKGQIIESIDWTSNPDISAYVYSASYSKYDIGVFAAGSTGADCSVKIYKDSKNNGKHQLLCQLKNVNQGCFSLDFSHKKSQLIFTTANRGFYVYDIKRK